VELSGLIRADRTRYFLSQCVGTVVYSGWSSDFYCITTAPGTGKYIMSGYRAGQSRQTGNITD